MWNGLNREYWETHANERITGIEVAQFQSVEQMEEMVRFCEQHNIQYGIHSPVLAGEAYSLPPITSLVLEEREDAYSRLEQEAILAARYGADYLLAHYPYPPILPKRRDPELLRLFPPFERYEMEQMTQANFVELSRRAFDTICELQVQHNQRIVLEYDFFGDLEHSWIRMFEEFPDALLVVDLQRLDIHRKAFPDFDPYPFMKAIAKQVYLVHYSNVKYVTDKSDRHLPVLPSHQQDPQYGDAYDYLDYLSRLGDKFHITFEHNPAKVSREELAQCYECAALLIQKGLEITTTNE
jgi:hypothetical protein